MKSFLDFIKYNNAFPIVFSVVILGTGAAFAASPDLRQAVFSSDTTAPVIMAPEKTDTKKLLSENIEKFDISPKIDAITEDSETYYVAYSYRTLEVASGAWREARKTGKMEIPKKLLGKRDLKTYLAEQIGQVIDRELAYLRDAQSVARVQEEPKNAREYAGLVGHGVDRNAKQAPTKTGQDVASDAPSVNTAQAGLSEEEIREMIVKAVADFLAIDTSMPEFVSPAETVPIEPETIASEPAETRAEPVTAEASNEETASGTE